MASDSESKTIREQRQAAMGNDERASDERRRIQKLIQDNDELVIPELFEKLDDYLVKPTNAALLPAETAAIGLGKLSTIGDAETHSSKAMKKKGTVEDLLIYALSVGKNRMQCAAADALGQIGTLTCQEPLQSAAGVAGNAGDRNASVRARAKIGLRRVNMRVGNRDLSGNRALKSLTSDEFQTLVQQACTGEPEFQLDQHDEKRYSVVVTLPGDLAKTEEAQAARTQKVFVQFGNSFSRSFGRGVVIRSDYVVLYTFCGPANEKAYKAVLQMNALRLKPESLENQEFGFAQGAVGIHQNEIVMIDTQPIETVTKDSIYSGIRVLATLGDEIEKKLPGGGKDKN